MGHTADSEWDIQALEDVLIRLILSDTLRLHTHTRTHALTHAHIPSYLGKNSQRLKACHPFMHPHIHASTNLCGALAGDWAVQCIQWVWYYNQIPSHFPPHPPPPPYYVPGGSCQGEGDLQSSVHTVVDYIVAFHPCIPQCTVSIKTPMCDYAPLVALEEVGRTNTSQERCTTSTMLSTHTGVFSR